MNPEYLQLSQIDMENIPMPLIYKHLSEWLLFIWLQSACFVSDLGSKVSLLINNRILYRTAIIIESAGEYLHR